jgi:hypothetical protein
MGPTQTVCPASFSHFGTASRLFSAIPLTSLPDIHDNKYMGEIWGQEAVKKLFVRYFGCRFAVARLRPELMSCVSE